MPLAERCVQADHCHRQRAISQGIARLAQAENALTQTLGRLFALAEAYPDLKANQNFLALQEELTSTENKVGFARQYFNRTVSQLNQAMAVFPASIIAGMFGFTPMEFFEIQETAQREAPKVAF